MRALVTRPREDAESLIAALATRSVEALVEPLMEVHYQSPGTLDLGGVQAILCTSANGVRALARASGERDVPVQYDQLVVTGTVNVTGATLSLNGTFAAGSLLGQDPGRASDRRRG